MLSLKVRTRFIGNIYILYCVCENKCLESVGKKKVSADVKEFSKSSVAWKDAMGTTKIKSK